MDVELLDDGVHFLALVGALGDFDVPFYHLAVEKQRGVGVAFAVIGRVERPEADLGLSHDGVPGFDLVCEQVIKLADIEHCRRRRQLAVGDDVNAIGCGIDAMGAVGDGDVARECRPGAAIEDRNAADRLELPIPDRFFDALEVENDDPVLLLGHHLRQRNAFLGVVAGREGVFALVVGIDIVEVAIDHDLPGDLHGVAIDRREDRTVGFGIVHGPPVIGDRDAILTIGEHVASPWIFLHPQAVDRVLVGELDDLVALHHVQPDAADARVQLVVSEQVPPVICAVGEG